ncbi:hypothetical protein KY339_05460 [Candidatus Woesearchaeota archaeon]|nr:hypothetical protein [Candidatus Woesearchaeota archaeon]
MKLDKKVLLSTLWIFAVLNYLYADVIGFFKPGMIQQIMTGSVDGMAFTPVFLLVGAILMETAIIMVLLSRVLAYKWNRITNIIAGAIHTLAVSASMFVGTLALYYIFFATIEIITTVLIVWFAWTWKK